MLSFHNGNKSMNNTKIISSLGSAMAILCILFLPFVGCGEENLTGMQVIQHQQIGQDIKAFVILSILCGLLIFFFNRHVEIAITAVLGIASLFISYLIAHSKNAGIELRIGAFLSIGAYVITALVNFFGMSNKGKTN